MLNVFSVMALFIGGFYVGKIYEKEVKKIYIGSKEENKKAYRDVISAFIVAESALNHRSLDEKETPQDIVDNAWNSLGELLNTFNSTKFLLSEEAVDIIEESMSWELEMSWSKKLENLCKARNSLYTVARRDMSLE